MSHPMANFDEKEIFFDESYVAKLGLIVTESAQELGKKINKHLIRWATDAGMDYDSFIVESECPRFSSGDGKGIIKSTVRGDDLFFLVDTGNYSCTYKMFGVI